jgi:signal transduction histidine kinase/ActR/RegA family two-component response regulator
MAGESTAEGRPDHDRPALDQQQLEKLYRELVLREAKVGEREAAALETERRLADLVEANQHLVFATLAAEQLEEAAQITKRRQDEFLAMLAHELRNPLAPIAAAVSLLQQHESKDPVIHKISDVVGRQVALMARLLDDLLDASRITRGTVTLHRTLTPVREFIDAAVEMNRPLFDAGGICFSLEMPVTPLHVDGDAARLTQVFGNLMNNAAKYTPAGGSVALSVRSVDSAVEFRVSDSGVGIAHDTLPLVFDLFAQDERSLSRSQGGLGIGLTVVRSIVELHGGTVTARSGGPGQGSEFTVLLPRAQFSEPDPPIAAAQPSHSASSMLVVDDNVDAAQMLSMVFQELGYQVETAYDGPGAVAAFDRHRPPIVLCDIGLPGLNGYEVAKRIRHAQGGPGAAALLIAITGYNSAADRAAALAAGFDHHLAKPVNFDELLALVVAHEMD